MKKRILGKSNLQVSEIGLGCWQLGGDFGPIEDKRALGILEAAAEQGITFFDTADVYGAGRSESYLGDALAPLGANVVVATKYGRGAGTYPDGYSLTDMRDSIRRAQDRLKRDVIDLIQLHCVPTSVVRHGEIFDWLRTVQQGGLINHFGASVETLEEAFLCTEQEDIASLQIIFNLFRQRPIEKLFDVVSEKNIGIIVRLPLASGMLSGKYTKDTHFAESDHRNYNKDGKAFSVGETFSGIPFDKGLDLVEQIKTHKPETMNMAQFAMRWILDHDAVTSVIAGASSVEQVAQNVSVSSLLPLPPETHKELFDFYLENIEQHIRGVF